MRGDAVARWYADDRWLDRWWYALGCKASLTNKKLKLPFDKPTVVLEMAMHF